MSFLCLVCLIGPAVAMADDEAMTATSAGYRKFVFTYKAEEEERRRNVFLCDPSAKVAERYDDRSQIGFVSPDAEIADGSHPLILFSHGLLGSGDQTIF